MSEFVESDYNDSQRRNETACREANASDQRARVSFRQEIEDSLVAGGQEAIDEYVAGLNKKWKEARSNVEYTGLSLGYAIVKRAKARLGIN